MMKLLCIIYLAFLFLSCSNPLPKGNNSNIVILDSSIKNKTQQTVDSGIENLDSIKKAIQLIKNHSKLSNNDTLEYNFYLNDVGTEGNEGIAYYFKDSLRKITIDIYTSMWRYQIEYSISKNEIHVNENTYNISPLYHNKNKKTKEISYSIDLDGNPIGNVVKERIDIFQEFKNVVPFQLN